MNAQDGRPAAPFDPFAGPALLREIPSTEPQREIWTATRIDAGASLAYNESVTLALAGPLDVAALRGALAQVAARHESLHSTFSEDGLAQLVIAPQAPPLEVEDLSALDAAAGEERFASILSEEALHHYDLARGPLLRARLVKLAEGQHRLVITAHHIVCDGWSTAVVVRELAAIYSASREGKPADLPAAASFATYAAGEAAAATSPELQTAARYWEEKLAGDPPPLELPTDRQRPPARTFSSLREDVVLPAALVKKLRQSCAKERSSLFQGLLAGFFALLHRLSGSEDVLVGIPTAGQAAREELSNLVGHCVNMLPIRARLHGALPFRELLATVRTAALDAMEHQQLTYGAILRKLPLARDPSRPPLVSVVFNLDRGLPPSALPFAGLTAALTTNPRQAENFELFLNAVELGDEVHLECQYNRALFDGATVRRWLAAYALLLEGAAANPAAQIGDLPLLTAEDATRLATWNAASALAVPPEAFAHRLFEQQAARVPDKTAVLSEAGDVSYAGLAARAHRIARRLRALGIGRGSMVGLCLERTPDLLAALFGILESGAAYVPLDPGYPRERLAFMAADSQMPVVITDARLVAELSLPVPRALLVDDAALLAEDAAALPPSELDASPEDPAYVIYTSGSTGKPKGVLVPHRALANLLASVQRTPGMTERDVVLAITTLSFDIAVSEAILPLTVGATIALASREVAADGLRLLRQLREQRVTFVDATPATWRLLLAAGWTGGENLKAICTGEAMPRDLARELLDRVGELWNGYGPTETTVWSTFWRVQAPVARVLIGKPVANTQIHVLDGRLRPQPPGVPGELFIGGSGVTMGYLGRPDLTRERFVADPFSASKTALLYRTGDLGRWLPDGNLECLGRNDNQVKLRGFRIELGEIEDALAQHPDVSAAAVVLREDRPGDKRLVGYLSSAIQPPPDDASLRSHVRRTLTDYMVPSAFVRLPKLPLTPSGKIDRRALPAPQASDAAQGGAFVAPKTPTEQALSVLWREALNLPRVSTDEDFFLLGGHSLLASQVLARVRRDLGVEVPFRKMFEAPTIERFAALIDAQSKAPAGARELEIPIHRSPGEAAVPSRLQERLALLEEMDPAQRLVHNLPAAWRLKGKLDRAALHQALSAIASRHEPLRTSFRREGTSFVPEVKAAIELPLPFADLSAEPADAREAKLMARLDAEARVLFDLAQAPLVRALLIKLAEEEHVLFLLPQNHVWDGWSFDLFLGELSALYAAFAAGKPSPLEPLPATYSDFAVWQRKWLAGPAAARQKEWWTRQLAGDPPALELSTDKPRPRTSDLLAGNEGLLLSVEEAENLRKAALGAGATLFHVAFAAYAVLLHRLSQQEEILVGTPVRARTRPEWEGLIGPFLNTLALRVRVQPGQSFAELVRQVRELTLDAFGQQEVPLETLGQKAPILRAFFSLQDARGRKNAIGPLEASQLHVLPPAAAGDLMLWMMDTPRGLFAMMNFRADLFEGDTVKSLLQSLRAILRGVVLDASVPVGRLPLLDEAALAKLRAADPPAPAAESIAARIDRLALEQPDRIALTGEGGTATRGVLREAASSWAALLRARKTRRLAVALPPGVDRIAALLGALRAGVAVALIEADAPASLLAARLASLQVDAVAGLASLAASVPAGVALLTSGELTPSSGALTAFDASLTPAAGAAAALLISAATDPDDRSAPAGVPAASLEVSLVAAAGRLGLGEGAEVAWASSSSLPTAPFALLLPLVAGGRLRQLPANERNPAALAPLLVQTDVVLAAADVVRGLSTAALPRELRVVACGAPIDAAVAKALIDGGARPLLALGVPEAGIVSMLGPVGADGRGDADATLPGARVRVLDERGLPCPAGVPGRLAFGGAGPAPAGAKVDAADPSGWVALTPWKARRRGASAVDQLGRVDGKLDHRGLAVDPALVKRALEAHPKISRAEAGLRHSRGEPRLVAWYELKPGESATETELRRSLRGRSAEELVPQAFVELDGPQAWSSPKGLPDPFEADNRPAQVPPRTPAEKLLAELWQEVLGPRAVSVHDNFFQLGGHSLLLFEVLARLEKRSGKRLIARSLLLNTLAQAAAELGELGPVAPGPTAAAQANTTASKPPAPSSAKPSEPSSLGGRMLDRLKKLVK